MNPFDILKNFREKLSETTEKLNTVVCTGSSGGDLVQVDMNGQMEVRAVRISREIIDPEDPGTLEALIVSACANARDKVREKLQAEFGPIAGGLPKDLFGGPE